MRHLAACWEHPTLDLTLVTYVIIGRIRVLLLALVSAVLVHVDLRREGSHVKHSTIQIPSPSSERVRRQYLSGSVGLPVGGDGLQLDLLLLLLLDGRLLVVVALLGAG